MGEIMRLLRQFDVARPAFERDRACPRAAAVPAKARSSVDFPAPLRPVTISASPAESEKLRPIEHAPARRAHAEIVDAKT